MEEVTDYMKGEGSSLSGGDSNICDINISYLSMLYNKEGEGENSNAPTYSPKLPPRWPFSWKTRL